MQAILEQHILASYIGFSFFAFLFVVFYFIEYGVVEWITLISPGKGEALSEYFICYCIVWPYMIIGLSMPIALIALLDAILL